MHFATRLTPLRFATKRLYQRTARELGRRSTISPWAFLSLPIYERLILLARLDGATPYQIHQAFHFAFADTSIATDRMELAMSQLRRAVLDPLAQIDDVPVGMTTRQLTYAYGRQVDRLGWQILYPEVPLCLFGDTVPTEFADLTLRERAVLYCLLVEDMEWRDIATLFGCTRYFIRAAILRMMDMTSKT